MKTQVSLMLDGDVVTVEASTVTDLQVALFHLLRDEVILPSSIGDIEGTSVVIGEPNQYECGGELAAAVDKALLKLGYAVE